MRIILTVLLSILCVSLAVRGDFTQEQKLGIWHKFEDQDSYSKRGEIVYTLKPQTARYIPDEKSLQLKHAEGGLYLVKLVNPLENTSKEPILSSAKWCLLESSLFNDKFTLHFDKEGNFFHADYHPGAHSCGESDLTSEKIFNTTVELAKPIYERRPRLQRVTQEELEQKEQASNTNFFVKYWYIILPLVLVLLVGGGDPPKEG